MGALLLLRPSGAGQPDLGLAGTLAEAAAVGLRHAHALHQAETVGDQLREALRSRVVIEQAKGALALHAGLDVEEAFVALRGHARRRGLGLTDLARRVVAGEIELSAVAPGRLS
jgi:AmiR/NasT family two-component response regulator